MNDNLSKEILTAKEMLDTFLKDFLTTYNNVKDDKKLIQSLINDLISNHSRLLNTASNSVGRAHQIHDFFYNNDLQKDYSMTIEGFITTSLKTLEIIEKLIKKHNLASYSVNEQGYFTLQKLINTFSERQTKEKIKKEFEKKQISTLGFNQKFKKMKHKHLKIQLLVGIPLLLLSVLLIFIGEYYLGKPFNGIQLIILKALIALSISIVGSSLIEGNVETDWTLTKGLTIRALGWVAIFLLIYFLNPSNPGDVY